MYLGYFHVRKQVISPRGDSYVTLRAQIADHGLPTDIEKLQSLYYKYLEFRGVAKEDAAEDLLYLEQFCKSPEIV
ncbi:hypothetical protein M8J76_001704 [Diaphorina citri]|nr:hypothetical protein M8J75_013956 [Diaphorina citri]KAI5708715.1 hypothetical protein M8J76_001704 [Diaphorina citri]